MKPNYIALGVTPNGNALVLRPIMAVGRNGFPFHQMLCDIERKSFDEACQVFGYMLIAALGAYHPEVDRYDLVPEPPKTISFPTNPPPEQMGKGEMRALRMGLGFASDAAGPTLVIRVYDGSEPNGEEQHQSLAQLAALGKSVAPSIIGAAMLRQLAAMHPDVLAPLFPALAPSFLPPE
jgi:hypothetical protein